MLAAGLGTRMRSRLPKVLHPLLGRPMLGYVLAAATEATGTRPIVVFSPATAAIRDVFAAEADFVLQTEPRGTGDALAAAIGALPPEAEEVLVVSGDVPLVRPDLLSDLLDARRLDHAAVALTAVDAIDPAGLGRVVRNDGGAVERVVEEKDASDDERLISEINAGLYAIDAGWLRRRIGDLLPSPASGELYLTDLVAFAREDGRIVAALDVEDDGRLTGINDRSQLARAEWDLRVELNDRWMKAGVTMHDPSTVYLDHEVQLASDVVLEPNVILRGATRVGEGSVIGAGSQLFDTVVGERSRVWASVIEQSTIDDDVTVGPYTHVRAGSHIAAHAQIGNFAEVKNSRIGRHVKSHHVSYLGDAELGDRTNVGAGTITANWDGTTKHRTTVGERVFLGVDTMIVAPRTIGDGARTGAGSVVTKDIPPGKLAVGVPARIREQRREGGEAPGGSAGGDPGPVDPAEASSLPSGPADPAPATSFESGPADPAVEERGGSHAPRRARSLPPKRDSGVPEP